MNKTVCPLSEVVDFASGRFGDSLSELVSLIRARSPVGSERLFALSVRLPESLLAVVDAISVSAGISRNKVLILLVSAGVSAFSDSLVESRG